jgi:hypothetical protein
MKHSKAFRLSNQALFHLAAIVKKTGSNETAIVELSLAVFAKQIGVAENEKSIATKSLVQDKVSGYENLAFEMGVPVEKKVVVSVPKMGRKKHKRKRH